MNLKTNLALDTQRPMTAPAQPGGCPPVVPTSEDTETKHWFVMRSSYSREMKAKDLLDKDGFECYVPTRQERIERNGKIEQRTVAVVHNLLFVHSTREALDPWKRIHEEEAALRYTIDKSTGKPMIVDNKSMQDFMRVIAQADDSLLFLDNPDIILTKGQKVEIILGPLKGVQGYILRIRRDRRVVVSLHGIVSVALAAMPMSHFKAISN